MLLEAVFQDESEKVYTHSVYQYDKDIQLLIRGVGLSDDYFVYFSNDEDGSLAISRKGTANGAKVPDELLYSGKYIYAWFKPDNELLNANVFHIVIPVIPRSIPITGDGEGDKWKYRVDEETEDLEFYNESMNEALEPNIEEEEN